MERLTRVFEQNNQKYVCIDVCGEKCVEGHSVCHDCKPFTDVLKKLVTYEDADEQGLLAKVVHAKWCKIDDWDDNDNALFECTNCHHGDVHARSVAVPYCWYCGAKMDGKEEGVGNA